LQCVTVLCSALQCVAVCCSVLQCVAVCCSVLQCVAVCCSAKGAFKTGLRHWVAVCCIALQCVTVGGSALQCVAVRCIAMEVFKEDHTPPTLAALTLLHTYACIHVCTHVHADWHERKKPIEEWTIIKNTATRCNTVQHIVTHYNIEWTLMNLLQTNIDVAPDVHIDAAQDSFIDAAPADTHAHNKGHVMLGTCLCMYPCLYM